ncbi:MAG: hypothetical protein QM783_02220 [Phycisphaerales bacterium]
MGVVQGAMLGLLALLLGFSFSQAVTRFVARQDLLVAEANAVGTAWLRADLIPDGAEQKEMKSSLLAYTDARCELFENSPSARAPELIEKINASHGRAWASAVRVCGARADLAVTLLPPLNDLADLMTKQVDARRRQIPVAVLAVILLCALGSVASVGFASVFIERRTHLPGILLTALIAAALWLIIDLDYPRHGLIRLDGRVLTELRQGMKD